MLSDFEQDLVWQGMLGAEIRAAYFAVLVQRYQNLQKFLVVGSLLLSSGAPDLGWVKPLLTVLTAALSLWSLVAENERNAIDSADLHLRWNILAIGYQELWANIYIEDAQKNLLRSAIRKPKSRKAVQPCPRKNDCLREFRTMW